MIATLKKFKHYVVVLGFAVLSHGLGFGREVAIAYQFGVSQYADGLVVGMIPIIMYMSIWNSAYGNAALARIKTPDNHQLIAATLQPLLLVGGLSFLLFWFGAEQIIQLISPGLKDQGREMAVAMVKVTSIGVVLVSVAAWGKGILHLQRKFTRASLADIMPNFGYILGIVVLFQFYGVYGLAAGGLIGYFLQFCFSLEYRRVYFKMQRLDDGTKAQFKLIFRNMALAILSYSVVYVDYLVDRYFGSMLEEGSIAILGYAHKLMSFPLYTVIFAITTVMFPNLLQLAADLPVFKQKVKQVYWVILGLSVFIITFSILLDQFLVSLLFEYGAFDAVAVEKTASVFSIYMLGFMGHAYVVFGSKVRYALEDFRVPVFAGVVAALLNLLLDFILVDGYGREGLALATSIAAYCNAGILLFYGRKRQMAAHLSTTAR